jgi:hypothetical protein
MDRIYKYIEINNQFNGRVSDIRVQLKVSNRVCEKLAQYIAKENPKTALEQERIDKLTDYVIKTSELNDNVLGLIDYMDKLLIEIGLDARDLTDGLENLKTIEFQSDTIQLLTSQRDTAINDYYELRKNKINTK